MYGAGRRAANKIGRSASSATCRGLTRATVAYRWCGRTRRKRQVQSLGHDYVKSRPEVTYNNAKYSIRECSAAFDAFEIIRLVTE